MSDKEPCSNDVMTPEQADIDAIREMAVANRLGSVFASGMPAYAYAVRNGFPRAWIVEQIVEAIESRITPTDRLPAGGLQRLIEAAKDASSKIHDAHDGKINWRVDFAERIDAALAALAELRT